MLLTAVWSFSLELRDVIKLLLMLPEAIKAGVRTTDRSTLSSGFFPPELTPRLTPFWTVR